MSKKALLLVGALLFIASVALTFSTELLDFATLENLKERTGDLARLHEKHQTLAFLLFVFAVCIASALPIPIVAILCVAAGFLYGTFFGLLAVSFANAIGGSLTFVSIRYVARDFVQQRFARQLSGFNEEFRLAGFWYCAGLRLFPGIPFFVSTAGLSLAPISLRQFYLSTQLGMLPILFVLVNAGKNLSQIDSIGDIFSVELILSLTLLGAMPFLLRLLKRQITKLAS